MALLLVDSRAEWLCYLGRQQGRMALLLVDSRAEWLCYLGTRSVFESSVLVTW